MRLESRLLDSSTGVTLAGFDFPDLALELPPARKEGRIVADVPALIEALQNEAQVL